MKVFSFRNIRILILLTLLIAALGYTQEQKRNTYYWHKPLNVVIFPINADQLPETERYINALTAADFNDIDNFFSAGSKQYDLIAPNPVTTTVGRQIKTMPPPPPTDRESLLSVVWWSLKLRYWAYQNTPDNISNTDRIRLFVLFHQPQENKALAHSLGLQKGLIGVIHAFADDRQRQQNAVVMAHEILHTVGATDKYDAHNQPIYPIGYVEPERSPLFPQRYAEIMAGRIPLHENKAEMPSSLKSARIGTLTATEINWIK